MQAGHARLVRRRLALLANLLLDLLLGLGDDLLDPRRMDPPVLDQLRQRQARDLAAHRIEARQRHRVGRVVDDQVHAGRRFERANVAALSADDAALHLLVGDRHDGGRDLANRVARVALDRDRQDLARLRLGLLAGIHLDHPRAAAGFGAAPLLRPAGARACAPRRASTTRPARSRHLFLSEPLDLPQRELRISSSRLCSLRWRCSISSILRSRFSSFWRLRRSCAWTSTRISRDLLLGGGQGADGLLFGLEQDRFLFGLGAGAGFGGALLGQRAPSIAATCA